MKNAKKNVFLRFFHWAKKNQNYAKNVNFQNFGSGSRKNDDTKKWKAYANCQCAHSCQPKAYAWFHLTDGGWGGGRGWSRRGDGLGQIIPMLRSGVDLVGQNLERETSENAGTWKQR